MIVAKLFWYHRKIIFIFLFVGLNLLFGWWFHYIKTSSTPSKFHQFKTPTDNTFLFSDVEVNDTTLEIFLGQIKEGLTLKRKYNSDRIVIISKNKSQTLPINALVANQDDKIDNFDDLSKRQLRNLYKYKDAIKERINFLLQAEKGWEIFRRWINYTNPGGGNFFNALQKLKILDGQTSLTFSHQTDDRDVIFQLNPFFIVNFLDIDFNKLTETHLQELFKLPQLKITISNSPQSREQLIKLRVEKLIVITKNIIDNKLTPKWNFLRNNAFFQKMRFLKTFIILRDEKNKFLSNSLNIKLLFEKINVDNVKEFNVLSISLLQQLFAKRSNDQVNNILKNTLIPWENKWKMLSNNLGKLELAEIDILNFIDNKNKRHTLYLRRDFYNQKVSLKTSVYDLDSPQAKDAVFLPKLLPLTDWDVVSLKNRIMEIINNKFNESWGLLLPFLPKLKLIQVSKLLNLNINLLIQSEEFNKKDVFFLNRNSLEQLVILYLKGMDIVIEAIRNVLNDFFNVKWQIVLKYLTKLQSAYFEKIYFRDNVTQTNVVFNLSMLFLFNDEKIENLSLLALAELKKLVNYDNDDVEKWLQKNIQQKLGYIWKNVQDVFVKIAQQKVTPLNYFNLASKRFSVQRMFNNRKVQHSYQLSAEVVEDLLRLKSYTVYDIYQLFTNPNFIAKDTKDALINKVLVFGVPGIALFFTFTFALAFFFNRQRN